MENDNEGYEDLTEQECEDSAELLSKDSPEFAELYARTEGITAKRWQIHLESSRRLAAMGGTVPDLEYIRRLRVDEL
jgi:hypothetical protein